MIIKDLGTNNNYPFILDIMKKFIQYTKHEELWILEYKPVFTVGISHYSVYKKKNISGIPLEKSNRGGNITYHGPGQIIFYPLINIKKRKIFLRDWINMIENITVDLLKKIGIPHIRKNKENRGVYIKEKKISSIGLRISNGFSYHGISLNFNMDLTPFSLINPCGIKTLKMINITSLNNSIKKNDLKRIWIYYLQQKLEDYIT